MSTHVIHARSPRGPVGRLDLDRDPDRLAPHLEDAASVPGGHAYAIVSPRSEADVAVILSGAHTVLPIGAQSSLTGGATPRGEVLLSTSQMVDISIASGRVTAGPGVTLMALDAALGATGSWYPPAPTYLGATVGGIVATNAAGAATFKYGTTRRWIDALTVVLPQGDVLDLRRGEVHADASGAFEIHLSNRTVHLRIPEYRWPDVPKVSAGYYAAPGMDLVDLFVGAEGTLGVVTSATLRTVPARPAVVVALVHCSDRVAGLRLVGALRSASHKTWSSGDARGVDISAIEHMDRRSLDLLRADGADRRSDVRIPSDTVLSLLVTVELTGALGQARAYDELGQALEPGAPDTPLVRLCRLLAEHGVLDRTELALGAARQTQFLALREAVPVAVNSRIARARREVDPAIQKVAADVIVPFEGLSDLVEGCDKEIGGRGLDGAVWGHISDGNLHPNVLPRTTDELHAGRDAVLAIGRLAIALGGSPCAEHGVGRNPIKQQLVRELVGAAGIEAMRRVKEALDPSRKLAPGVLGI